MGRRGEWGGRRGGSDNMSLPANMPDLIRKCFGYSQLWPLRPGCSLNRARLYICRIQLPVSDLVPFFQRRPGPYCAKKTRIRSGWPDQVLAKRIWSRSKPVCKNYRALCLAECYQPATRLPLSDSVVFFHRWPESYCAKPGWIRFWFWLTVSGFGQTDPVWKQAIFWVARIIRPNSGQCFRANPDWMQIRSGVFTGLGQCQQKGNCDLCGGHF